MPIFGGKPGECFAAFRNHVAQLMAATLTRVHQIAVEDEGDRATLAFRSAGQFSTIPLRTRLGEIHFYLGQKLMAVHEARRKFRLRTLEYWYRIQTAPGLKEQALIRWEYVSDRRPEQPGHCRNHLQIRHKIELGDGVLSLNKSHLPTGWVTMEEIVRFLIVDLHVEPPCGDDWPKRLAESERRFYEEFTSKRYK